MPELWPGLEPAQADTTQHKEETGAHAQSARRGDAAPEPTEAGRAAQATQAGADESVRHAAFLAGAGVKPPAWQLPAADVSPQCGAQAGTEINEMEIEL
jgi:hypothetical protein